jgi:hypothetical protein
MLHKKKEKKTENNKKTQSANLRLGVGTTKRDGIEVPLSREARAPQGVAGMLFCVHNFA